MEHKHWSSALAQDLTDSGDSYTIKSDSLVLNTGKHCAYFNHSVSHYAVCQHPDQPKTWLKKDKICMLHFSKHDTSCGGYTCTQHVCNRYISIAHIVKQ